VLKRLKGLAIPTAWTEVAPPGKESNWVQTWPGKGWSVILRLYGPEQAFFDKTWRPGEFEEIN
jgi:hypothetical protein